jgi:hypothetical protein
LDRYTEIGVVVPACQVHDMVLELINQLSAEEGLFTTLLSEDGQQASTLTSAVQKMKIRRLSIHNSNESYASAEAREQLSKVRSLDIFGKVKSIPPLSSFHVLRLLQVDDCTGLENNHLNNLGRLCLSAEISATTRFASLGATREYWRAGVPADIGHKTCLCLAGDTVASVFR